MDVTLVHIHLNWLNWFHFFFLFGGPLVVLIDWMIFLSLFLDVYRNVFFNCFFPYTARLWNFLPAECFPLTYDLNGYMSRVNRHFFHLGLFFLLFVFNLFSFPSPFSCNWMYCSGFWALHQVNPTAHTEINRPTQTHPMTQFYM